MKDWIDSMPDCLAVEMRGNIAVLTLNRPEKRNALSDSLVLGLQQFFDSIPQEVQAVVMKGAGDTSALDWISMSFKKQTSLKAFTPPKLGSV